MKEKLAVIGSLVFLLITAFGVNSHFESRFALAQHLQKAEQKIDKAIQIMDYKFKSLQSQSLQDRIWKIEDRYGKNPNDPTVRDTLRKLYQEKEQIDRELKVMERSK